LALTRDLEPDFGAVLGSSATRQDPYPVYRTMRVSDPVHWSREWGVWVLTRYDDTLAVLRDPARFSNASRYARFLDGLPADAQADVQPLRDHYAGGLIQSDPPDHTRLRALVRLAFTPRVIEGYRGRIQALVDELLAGRADTEIELVREFAYKVPINVMCGILGVPAVDTDRIYTWNDDMMKLVSTGAADADAARLAARTIVEVESYFGDLVDDRRRHPGTDLTSSLIAAHDAGDSLSRSELISTCVTLLFAGHETTKNLIANGILALLRHPDQANLLRARPECLPTAIEECLRFESPIQRGWRRVMVDTEIHDRQLKAGDLVYYLFGAANRDPEHFSDPDEFDITRQENRHLAFGYGIHFCIGAPLARLEGSIAIDTLLNRFPRLEIVGEGISWGASLHVRCPARLPLRLSA
jgi:cytochrome P450